MMINLKLTQSIVLLAVISISACSSNSGSNTANDQTAMFEDPQAASVALQADDSQAVAVTGGDIEYLRIKHHMRECEGSYVRHCLLAQKEGSDEWTNFYDQIEGFDYQWGTEYEILVQVQTTDSGLADASHHQYSLLEVITETAHEANASFNYTTRKSHERIVEISSGQFSLLGGKTFTCTDNSCDALRSTIDQNQSAVLSFQHNANPTEPLVLGAVLCSDAASSFAAACL